MNKIKNVNALRGGILLAVMLFTAAAGSMLAAKGNVYLPMFCEPTFKSAVIFDFCLLSAISASGFFAGGSLFAAFAAGLKSFSLSLFATCFLKTYGVRRYVLSVPSFFGGALSLFGIFLLSLRAVDLSVAKRYNNIKADGTYCAAAFICLGLCAAGDFLLSLCGTT